MTTKIKSNLTAIIDTLNDEKLASLLDYAEFLQSKGDLVSAELQEPEQIARPEEETVVGAIKRLKLTYPMISGMSVFSAASSLMTDNMVNGRDPFEVINEMQALFEEAYKEMKEKA